MGFSVRPNFGVLFQGRQGFDPFQAVSAAQRNQQLGLQAAQLQQQQQQADLANMMQGQRLQASQEATQLRNQQFAQDLTERQRNRQQNKLMTQQKLEQDLYLTQQAQKQRQLEQELGRQQQFALQREREATAQRNMQMQAALNREAQERRIAAEREERQEKALAKQEEARRTQQIQQQVNQAVKNDDFDTVARLVGSEEALKLEKAKRGLTKESSEGAKYISNTENVLSGARGLLSMLDNNELTSGTLTYLKYSPEILQDFTLTPSQRRVRFFRDNMADAIGRLRSGGAINQGEEQRFMRFLPSAGDDANTIRFKLSELENNMQKALKAKGIKDDRIKEIFGNDQTTPQTQINVDLDAIRSQRRQLGTRLQQMEQRLKERGLMP